MCTSDPTIQPIVAGCGLSSQLWTHNVVSSCMNYRSFKEECALILYTQHLEASCSLLWGHSQVVFTMFSIWILLTLYSQKRHKPLILQYLSLVPSTIPSYMKRYKESSTCYPDMKKHVKSYSYKLLLEYSQILSWTKSAILHKWTQK